MKVHELIHELQQYPADMPVMVDGYEEGYDELNIVKRICVRQRATKNLASWKGDYTDCESTESQHGVATSVSAVLLPRTKQ
jgi:hypothetical protein